MTAGEALVAGGAIIAAAGSVALVCLTITAVVDGTATPLDVADKFYGTHFGDALGWIQGQYAPIALSLYAAPNGEVIVAAGAPKPRSGSASAPHAPPDSWPDSQRANGREEKRGRLYATYTKFSGRTQRYYSGRTSMVVDLHLPLEIQAALAVRFRDINHHIDETEEPKDAAPSVAQLDVFDMGTAIHYDQRYNDPAYWRIRGREQQLIDSYGGAQSDTGTPYRTDNVVRAVAKDNPRGKQFHDAATARWGQLFQYTGY